MATVRQRRLRSAGALLLAMLLLVPVLASGHHHARHPGGNPCATCAVTRHTPIVIGPLLAAPVYQVVAMAVDVAVERPSYVPARRGAPPRAPPSSDTART